MIEKKFPNSRTLFRTNWPDRFHLAQIGSHFAQSTTPNPCSLLSSHTRLSGVCRYAKHPQSPTQHTPFPVLNLKVVKLNQRLGKMDPHWANFLKGGQNFSRCEQKKLFMGSGREWARCRWDLHVGGGKACAGSGRLLSVLAGQDHAGQRELSPSFRARAGAPAADVRPRRARAGASTCQGSRRRAALLYK